MGGKRGKKAAAGIDLFDKILSNSALSSLGFKSMTPEEAWAQARMDGKENQLWAQKLKPKAGVEAAAERAIMSLLPASLRPDLAGASSISFLERIFGKQNVEGIGGKGTQQNPVKVSVVSSNNGGAGDVVLKVEQFYPVLNTWLRNLAFNFKK